MQAAGWISSSMLTPRQYEITQLVAAGLTNQEIADRLGITPGTVSMHVSNILWCLRLTRRRQIASWSIEEAWAASRAAAFSWPTGRAPEVTRVSR